MASIDPDDVQPVSMGADNVAATASHLTASPHTTLASTDTARPHKSTLQPLSQHEPRTAEWVDATDVFTQARREMDIGEMLHTKAFTLHSAMSAIELMDPKMDIGYGDVKHLMDIDLPPTLSKRQVINVMDQLFALEMSWLDSHTLVQTVFSCVYTQRLAEIPCSNLFYFVRLQLATMHLVHDTISRNKIAVDEEDFVIWTFSLRIPQMEHKHLSNLDMEAMFLDKTLRSLTRHLAQLNDSDNNEDEEKRLNESILLRITFRIKYYLLLRILNGHYTDVDIFDCVAYIDQLSSLLDAWTNCPFRETIDAQLLKLVFNISINRHLMTSTPPRTAALLDVPAALRYMQTRVLTEFRSLLSLRQYALPPYVPAAAPAQPPRFSLHVAIHAIESFCSRHQPVVLSRTVMADLMLRRGSQSTYLFDNERATFSHMLLADMGLSACDEAGKQMFTEDISAMDEAVVHIFQAFCKNTSRQRQHIIKALRWWDQNTYIAVHGDSGASTSISMSSSTSSNSNNSSNIGRNATGNGNGNGNGSASNSLSSESNGVNANENHVGDGGATVPTDVNSNNDSFSVDNNKQHSNSSFDAELDNANTETETENENDGEDASRQQQQQKQQVDTGKASRKINAKLEDKTLFETVSYEVCCRLLTRYWLLGFECELYHEFEYNSVFFYLAYVLSESLKATTSLVKFNLANASLHPIRYAVYLIDDAKLSLCHALSTLLTALSDSSLYSYANHLHTRHKTKGVAAFGSDQLCYEQRFAVASNIVYGPPYVSHASFIKSLALQRQNDTDLVSQASVNFLAARKKLETCKKFMQSYAQQQADLKRSSDEDDNTEENSESALDCNEHQLEHDQQTMLLDELLKLGAVAVENSLTVAQITKDLSSHSKRPDTSGRTKDYAVKFEFKRHHHFPVVKVIDKT